MKVCFVGSHGTGKSTASYHLTSLLKQANPAKSVICLEENIRSIAQLAKVTDPIFPKLAITNQIYRELNASLSYQTIIADRSTLDYVVYAVTNHLALPQQYSRLAINHMREFDKIYFIRPENNKSKIASDGFRDTNIKFRNKVDDGFAILMKINYLQFTEIKSSQILTFDYLKDLQ